MKKIADTIMFAFLKNVLCFVIAILVSPLCWSVYVLMLAHRLVTYLLVGRKSVPVLGMSNFLGQELYSPNCMMNGVVFIEGQANLESLKNKFWNNVVLASDEQGNQLFPKLSCSLSFRWGFLFWSNSDKMDAEKHIYEHPGGAVRSEDELEKVMNEYFNRLLPSGRPAWECILVRFEDDWRLKRHPMDTVPGSVFMLRFHHSIMDGVTISRICGEVMASNGDQVMSALRKMLGGDKLKKDRKRFKIYQYVALSFTVTFGFALLPFLIVKAVIFGSQPSALLRQGITNKKFFCTSNPIPLSKIKSIKNAITGSTINDVFMSATTKATEAFIQSKFASGANNTNGPLLVAIPISMHDFNRPATSSNQIFFTVTKLATDVNVPRERVLATKKLMDACKKSMGSLFQHFLQNMASFAFSEPVFRALMFHNSPDIVYSNIPSSPVPIIIDGHFGIGVNSFTPNFHASGLSIMYISYCDSFTINVVMDTGIGSCSKDAKKFIEMMEEQIYLLEESCCNKTKEDPFISIPRMCDVVVEKCLRKVHG